MKTFLRTLVGVVGLVGLVCSGFTFVTCDGWLGLVGGVGIIVNGFTVGSVCVER